MTVFILVWVFFSVFSNYSFREMDSVFPPLSVWRPWELYFVLRHSHANLLSLRQFSVGVWVTRIDKMWVLNSCSQVIVAWLASEVAKKLIDWNGDEASYGFSRGLIWFFSFFLLFAPSHPCSLKTMQIYSWYMSRSCYTLPYLPRKFCLSLFNLGTE